MNTIHKVFLTSLFAVFVVYSGVATASLIDSTTTTTCDTGLGSSSGTIKFFAKYQANSYTCNPGTYLDKTTATCVTCGTNYFCPGGTFVFNGENQGLNECDPSKYKFSSAGSWARTQCYSETGTEDCSKLNKVSNGTATYVANDATYKAYPGGNQTDNIGACAITDLTCDTGYTKTPASNGVLANYTHQSHNISGTTTKYRALSGDNGYNLNSTGLTNGQWQIGWTDGTVISGVASCNTTTVSNHEMSSLNQQMADGTLTEEEKQAIIWADGGIGSRSANTFNSQSTGTNCWCKMDSYTLTGGSAQTISSSTWKLVGDADSTDECANFCAFACIEAPITYMSAFLGTLGQQMACVANSVTCDAGAYLSGVLGQCVTCLADHYCAGGTFTLNGSDQGISSCPVATPNSNPGAKLQSDCYVGYSCPAGQYLEMGKTTCAPCPAGSYCPDAGVYPFSAIADQGRKTCPTDANGNPQFSPQGSTSSDACTTEITCPAGQYVAAGGLGCTICPANSYCLGDKTCRYSASSDCGITSCNDVKMDKNNNPVYPYSDMGSTAATDCHGATTTGRCSDLNPVENGTAGYQNTTASYTPYSWGNALSPVNACAITSLTCDSGYTLDPTSNGALAYYFGQRMPTSGASFRAISGDNGINSSTEEGLGSSAGMTNGTWKLSWADGTSIYGRASCNTTVYERDSNSSGTEIRMADNNLITINPEGSTPLSSEDTTSIAFPDMAVTHNEFNSSSTGAYCWCNVTGYNVTTGSTVAVNDSYWLPLGAIRDSDKNPSATDCADKCSVYCIAAFYALNENLDYSDAKNSEAIDQVFGAGVAREMGCNTSTYTCEPGYYLPMGTTQCALCTAGSFCDGGTFEYSVVANGGLKKCGKEAGESYPNSDAGARSIDFCYSIEEDKECSEINKTTDATDSVTYANTKADIINYYNAFTAVSPAGACAISSMTCKTGADLTPTTNGPLSDSVLQSIPYQANTAIKYRAINGDNGENSNTNNQGAITGLSNGEFEVDLGSAKIHGVASYAYSSGNYYCQCSMNSYTLSGGSSVTVNPAKTALSNKHETQANAESSCASDCAWDVAQKEDFRTALFAELGQQKTCVIPEYTCAAGTYLPKEASACAPCPAGSWCGGGIFSYNASDAQGIAACPSERGYTNSAAGATAITQCYDALESKLCSGFNSVENGTPTYANSSAVEKAGYYTGQETQTIGACAITSLTCNNGYTPSPSTNGPLANYINQIHNLSKSNTKFRASNGDSGENSGAKNGYGDSTGMTNGTMILQWSDGTKVNLRASCNGTEGTNVGDTRRNETFTSSSTGKHCWCNMTKYQLNGQSAVNTNNTDWAYVNSDSDNDSCASKCAMDCTALFFEYNDVSKFATKLFGEYGQKMACGTPSYTCAPGEYLAAGATSCSTCPTGKYCIGGTYTYNAGDAQGVKACPDEYPNSEAGTYAQSFCYKEQTVNCSAVNSITNATAAYANNTATQRTYYNNGSGLPVTSVIPVGACAITNATCTVSGEALNGSAGPLANYETPMFGMPSNKNKNVYYRAINGDTGRNSGSNEQGDHTGMVNGTFRVVYGSELEITGRASCPDNSDYNCYCYLTSYKIGNGNTIQTDMQIKYSGGGSSCEDDCAQYCANRVAALPEFGALGDNRECGTPTYTCAPGEFLAANATTCSTCPSGGYYCPGGTWEKKDSDQGKLPCPTGYAYSDAGNKSINFCYKDPGTQQCSALNPVVGANVTYANQTATVRTYYVDDDTGIQQIGTIGACAISSATCNTGYTSTNTTDGPLAPYVNQSRNLNLASTRYMNFDGSASGAGEFYNGNASGMTPGTFELVYNNGTKIMGRISCNSIGGNELDTRSYSTFNIYNSGNHCWCNMTGYQLNGQSA
ncbi:MAG: hypothetical protein J6W08_00780, partial [Alphaproteobacteria bacterium]|nr:hypothetical protein [Alphaproteobacteria bacterium]